MPTLIKLEDGTVRWDYDLPVEQPKSAKKAAAAQGAGSKKES